MTTAQSRPTGRPSATVGLLLGVAMGAANVLGYLMVVLLSRTLGPADFGGYSALSTYGVILAIPAGAFQIIVARRLSAADGSAATSGLRVAAVVGAALLTLTAATSPLLARWFHLPSPLAALLAGGLLLPMVLTGCFQGILLGSNRIRRLAVLYLIIASSRLLAAVVAAWRGWGVTQVYGAMLVAAIVAAGCGAWLCRARLAALPSGAPGMLAEAVRSNSTLAAYVLLTNVDVLLARHYLSAADSGGYALASSFGRAIGWGTQFVALLIVPRMHGRDTARTLLRASGLVLGLGLAALGVVAISPSTWITLAGGPQFRGYGTLALACVGLGIAWALAQVSLFSELGRGGGLLGALTWGVIAAEVAAIVLWHHSPGQLVVVCTVGAVLVAATGLTRAVAGHRSRSRSLVLHELESMGK